MSIKNKRRIDKFRYEIKNDLSKIKNMLKVPADL